MYTEYNSNNVNNDFNNNYNNNNDFNNNSNNTNNSFNNDYNNPYEPEKPNKFLSALWKILLVIIILVVGFILLIQFNVISFTSSVMPNAIILNQNEIGIKKGKSYQLVSTVLPEDANNKQVIWTSSDPKIVSVNETTGYITGLKEGSATITVKTLINDVSTDCVVNVTGKNVLISSINIHQKRISVAVGYTYNLTYSLQPSNATENNLVFSSSDQSVAIINQNGVIKGLKEGNAIITVATSNGKVKDTTYVTVYKSGTTTVVDGEPVKTTVYPKSINISNNDITLKVGSTISVVATVLPSDANQSLSWTSSNSRVATVDSNGLITAISPGTATIVAKTVNDITANIKVTVGDYSVKLKSISVNTNYLVMPLGKTMQLSVLYNPKNASNKTITWESSNSKVVTVNSSGYIKAVGPGTAIIKAISADGGYTDTATIEVTGSGTLISASEIVFKESSYLVGINGTISLNPIITPSNATFKAIKFTSSDTSIASVDENGLVKGLKEGTVNITATLTHNNLKATTKVIVKYIPVTSIKLNNVQAEATIKKGETLSISAEILPSNASNKNISFTSSDSNIAKVDSNGIITGISTGRTTIIAKSSDGASASLVVNIVN